MATKRKTGGTKKASRSQLKRLKHQVCSGGRVVVKPGQSRYEAQQEALNKSDKPAATDPSPASPEEVDHVSDS